MGENWLECKCTCPTFPNEYVRIHLMGVAIIENMYIVPDEASCKTIPINRKRKRGRPAKVKKALIVE